MKSAVPQVLLVDDDATFVDRTRQHLERSGMRVRTEAHPERALSRVRDGQVDCIVSEYDLPDRTGLDLLEALDHDATGVPFVLFTSEGDEHLASTAIAAGVDEYVSKCGDGQFDLLANRVESAVEKRWTEARLARTEERYERLLETVPTPIVIHDAEAIKFVNEATVSFTGAATAGEIVGCDPMEFFDLSDTASAASRMRQVLVDREPVPSKEYELRTLDGDVRYAVIRGAPVTFAGKPASQVVINDVTEYREAQAELERGKRTLEAATDALDDFFFTVDADGTVSLWNDQVPKVTGYDDATLAEMSMSEFFADDQADRVQAGLDRLLEAGGSATVEADVRTADGEAIPFEFRGVRMTDASGDVVGCCGIGRDISDQRAYERELERYRALIETMNDPMYVVDERGNLTDVNRAMVERSGYDRTDLLGEYVGEFMDQSDVEAMTDLVSELLSDPDRNSASYEFEVEDGDGESRVVQDTVSVLTDENGDYLCTAGVLRDVTQERAQQRQLRRQNERLDRFAGLVSHDLRNPINVVQGFVDLAEETGDPEAFDRIRRVTDRMERLVDELLMLARTGAVVRGEETVDLGRAARDAWESVDAGDATLVVDGEKTLQADPERFAALLENLFANSLDHGGADDLTVRVLTTDDGFAVADDGVGLPDDREGLFEYGVSYDEGTGLGLAIVQEICEAHGWTVSANDASTGGARVDVDC